MDESKRPAVPLYNGEYFADALGLEQSDGIFREVFGLLGSYTGNRYGMTPDELFELDAE